MKPVLLLFWQICRFQKGPQDVPHSSPLLVVLMLCLVGLGAGLVRWFEPLFMTEKLWGAMAGLIAWNLIVLGVLQFKSLGARYVQTMTACVGTDLVLSLFSVPLQWWVSMFPAPQTPEDANPIAGLAWIALLVLMIWDILVKSRIYENAMQLGRIQANLLSITLWMSVLWISFSFIPQAVIEQ